MLPEKGRAPGGGQGHEKQVTSSTVSAAAILPPVLADDWERAAVAVNGMFVAVVYVADGTVRRYPCATLATAQRRVDRARERGHEASVVLAELRPVFVLPEVTDHA